MSPKFVVIITLIPDPSAWFTQTAVLYFSEHESKAVRASFPEDYWHECRKCKIIKKSVFLSMEEKVKILGAKCPHDIMEESVKSFCLGFPIPKVTELYCTALILIRPN